MVASVALVMKIWPVMVFIMNWFDANWSALIEMYYQNFGQDKKPYRVLAANRYGSFYSKYSAITASRAHM